ncbi:MAG: deiodinase-like protein [Paracoccaceae bacterium]
MSGYNYTEFDADHYELVEFDGPEMGGKAPDAVLTDLDGNPRNLLDFDGPFLVLEFGSITCPLFQSRRGRMAGIREEFPNVASVVIYVREAHPGIEISAHADLAEKTRRGCQLRDDDGEGREILIDSMNGAAHCAYGSYPNAVYIINKNGCVVYRTAWNNSGATRRVLRRLMAGKTVRAEGMFVPPFPPIALATFRQAGPGSARDFFKSLPKLAWNNLIRRNLRLLFRGNGGVRPDASC